MRVQPRTMCRSVVAPPPPPGRARMPRPPPPPRRARNSVRLARIPRGTQREAVAVHVLLRRTSIFVCTAARVVRGQDVPEQKKGRLRAYGFGGLKTGPTRRPTNEIWPLNVRDWRLAVGGWRLADSGWSETGDNWPVSPAARGRRYSFKNKGKKKARVPRRNVLPVACRSLQHCARSPPHPSNPYRGPQDPQ